MGAFLPTLLDAFLDAFFHAHLISRQFFKIYGQHLQFLVDIQAQIAVGRQDFQHAHIFAQARRFFVEALHEPGEDVMHDFTRRLAFEIGQDGQHPSVRGILA